MDSKSYMIHFYIIFLASIILNSTLNAKHYKVETFYYRKWLIVNVTCSKTNTTSPDETRNETVNSLNNFIENESLGYTHFQYEPLNADKFEPLKNQNDLQDSPVKAKIKETKIRDLDSLQNDTLNSKEGDVRYSLLSLTSNEPSRAIAKADMSTNCKYLKLGPRLLDSNIEELKIQTHGTLELSPDWAGKLTNLMYLNINSMHGLVLPSGCSFIPSSLLNLDLSYNPLKVLSMEDCSALLKKLFLKNSSLERLSICLPFLEELDASWNSLSGTGVEAKCPNATVHVKNLKLRNNQINVWSICGWPSLVHLELQENELASIDLSNCPAPHLKKINLSNNKLEQPPRRYPQNLAIINLKHNNLKTTTTFPPHIQEIHLSHNSLKEIAEETFRDASQLTSLDLSHNQLKVIYGHDFQGLHSLRFLDLSHNEIAHIRPEAFVSLRYVLSIRIDNNALRHLNPGLIDNLPENLHFQAAHNPWRCSCPLLTSIIKLSRSFCAPNCNNMPKLTCQESGAEVRAESILRECMNAMEELNSEGNTINLLPNQYGSDEDKSEERMEGNPFEYWIIIPIAFLLLGVPLVGLGIRKLYFQRKNMKRWCRCLSPFNSTTGRLSVPTEVERDLDSETEF